MTGKNKAGWWVAFAAALGGAASAAESGGGTPAKVETAYRRAVEKTADMASNAQAAQLVQRHGLQVLNLTWEDTGRYKGSSVGPNISDMTIQVATKHDKTRGQVVRCMPVIRYPNFSDKTCDLDPRDFTLLVGNQKPGQNASLKRVSLYDFLKDPTRYLSQPGNWKSPKRTLLAPNRDSKVLVSAQACFLPVPKQGKATFNPVLFNYQSYAQNPAVLTVLATREGTSATIIDNQRDGFSSGGAWGQRLFFNAHGKRTSLTGERESDFKAKGGDETNPQPRIGIRKPEAGLSLVLLIQIPLKQKERSRYGLAGGDMAMESVAAAAPVARNRAATSNVENAVIGHGDEEGVYTETDGIAIERDPRFPVRVTVQFYKATDNGVVSAVDVNAIKSQIDHVYSHSDHVGSLVVEGNTGRVTEYDGSKVQPANWWEQFWTRYEQTSGVSREEAIRRLRKLLGQNYQLQPVTDLYLRQLLYRKKA